MKPVTDSVSSNAVRTRKDRPPRVVIDTAVVMSALLFGGGPGSRLRECWQRGYCRPLLCRATLIDLQRALAQPQFGFSRAEQDRLLADYLPHALKVRVPEALREGDEPPALAYARLAMAGRAHVVVSSDPDLLALQGRLPWQVLALEPFLDAVAASAVRPLPLRHRPVAFSL